jgi:non-lysosomal glucosylceramidase
LSSALTKLMLLLASLVSSFHALYTNFKIYLAVFCDCEYQMEYRTAAKGGRPVTFAIAAKQTQDVTVSTCPCFHISGQGEGYTAKDMWAKLKQDGCFSNENWTAKASSPSKAGAPIGAALAAKVSIPPNEKRNITFSLGWDSPEVKFLKGKSYHRRYTKFYGIAGDAASKLVRDAICGKLSHTSHEHNM